MSRAFPETRACSRATLFAVSSFSVLIETGECESSSFTAGTSALRAVGESFARPSSSSSRRKTTLASSDDLGSIWQYEQIEFLFRAANGKLDPSRLIRQA